MATDWYFSAELQAAREEMLDAHAQLRAVRPLGAAHPDCAAALKRAIRADEAYFGHFPGRRREDGSGDDDWAAADAAASRVEGFTAGDPA
jgi:hypothetical protein